jgi:ankyrin repeat protein
LKDIEGRSALHSAAAVGAVEVIGVLIERGLDVNREDRDGLTPLHVACANGELEAVRELLRLGAKLSMTVVVGNLNC